MVDGQLHIEGVLVVAESGRVKGEVFAKQLVVNGILEGDCHAEQIQILANGRVKGKVWSNNLSIEPGGKFFGETAELPEKEVVSLKSQTSKEVSAAKANTAKTDSKAPELKPLKLHNRIPARSSFFLWDALFPALINKLISTVGYTSVSHYVPQSDAVT